MSVDTLSREDTQVDAKDVTGAVDIIKDALDQAGISVGVARVALRVVTGEYGVLASRPGEGDAAPVYNDRVTEAKATAVTLRNSGEVDRTAHVALRERYATFWSASASEREAARLLWVADEARVHAAGLARRLSRPGITVGEAQELKQELITTRRHAGQAQRAAVRASWDTHRERSRIHMVDADLAKAERIAGGATAVEGATALAARRAEDRIAVVPTRWWSPVAYRTVGFSAEEGYLEEEITDVPYVTTTELEAAIPNAHSSENALLMMQLYKDAEAAGVRRQDAEAELKRQLAIAELGTHQEAPHVRRMKHLRIGGVVLFAWGRRQLRIHMPSIRQAKKHKAMTEKFDRLAMNGDYQRVALPEYARYFFSPPEAPARRPEGPVRYASRVALNAVRRGIAATKRLRTRLV